MLKTLTQNRFAFGAVAGFVSALLMVAGQSLPVFSALLLTLAFSAIITAGLASGALAAALAVIVAAGFVSLTFSSDMAFFNMTLTLAPAALMSWLANFARPAEEIGGPSKALAWYPLADMLLYSAVAVAASSWLVLALNPMRDALKAEIFEQVKLMMGQMSPGTAMDAATEEMMRSMISVILPLSQSGQLLLVIFAAYYFAMRFLDATKLAIRPREDIPAALRMHPAASVLFLAGIVMMFAGGEVAVIGANLAGAFTMGFILAGFAVFHLFARGKSWATPGLILAYLATFVFSIPMLVFLGIGILNTRRSMAVTPRDDTPDQTQ